MTAHNKKNHKSKLSRPRKRRLAARKQQALSFEKLESRHLLAAITVTNATDFTNADTSSIAALQANDGGDGISLREAIQASNSTPGVDTITFDESVFTGGSASLIRLTQGELSITEQAVIDASNATDIVITGDANGNDVTEDDTFITNTSFNNLSVDNSRVINFTDPSGDLTLNNLTLTGGRIANSAGGGGIRFNSSGVLTGTNVTISGNRSRVGGGGGISTDLGSVNLVNSTLSGNISISTDFNDDVGGGAIYGGPSSTISLTNSLVNDNSTDGDFSYGFGGGVFSHGTVLLSNSTLSGNTARGNYRAGGGGLVGGNVVLTNSTVTENSTFAFGMSITNPTGSGGGLDVLGDLTIINSIVANNSADFADDIVRPSFGGGELILENSLIDDTTGSNITATTGTGNILNQSALLGPLADNGGPTLTHALLADSPAINAGNDALAVDADGNALTTDQRGEDRVKFDAVDIGAFESDFDSTFLLGDVDLNGTVNFLDIQPFIDLLANKLFQDEADIDGNGTVNFLDIQPFIDLLSSGGSAQSSAIASSSEAPQIFAPSVASSQPIVAASSVSSRTSVVTKAEPESIVSTATAAELPLASETSLAVATVPKAVAVSSDVSPVPVAPLAYSFIETGEPNLRSLPLETRRPLLRPTESPDLAGESRDKLPLVSLSTEDSFSTAAQLFDADPESIDEVLEFQFEDANA